MNQVFGAGEMGMGNNAYRAVKRIYHTLPMSFRQTKIASWVKSHFLAMAKHDWIYDADYYASDVEGAAVKSAPLISKSILDELSPKSVVDVGCGTGALLEAFRDSGCKTFGLEYSLSALQYCQKRGLAVERFDLEKDALPGKQIFDVALSMEVAEHLPEQVADSYVGLLTRLSDTVIITAAHPGQGGVDHVNEQPRSYWISKFLQLGFSYDESLVARLSKDWANSGTVASWYHENVMVFRRAR